MENQVKRPYLLTGLIVNIVCFAVLALSSIVSIFGIAASFDSGDAVEGALILLLFSVIIVLALSVVGMVFSAISIQRVKLDPEKFDKKKGFILTSFILDVVVVIFSIIGLCSGSFNVSSLLMTLALIAAAVLIMYEYVNNDKLLKQANTQVQTKEETTEVEKTEEVAVSEEPQEQVEVKKDNVDDSSENKE